MKVIGYLGSPRVSGKCSRLLKSALEGAESAGARTVKVDLIKCNIKYCMGCGNCFLKHPELSIGKCPLKDDMASLLEEYIQADGYIFATPVYDMFVTALMKTFLEREIALTYKEKKAVAKIPAARPGIESHFKKKASIIVTGNVTDEYSEVMADPCFEAFDGHFMIQQVDSVDRYYVGRMEDITEQAFSENLAEAHSLGARLVREIQKA